jgi:hypothetical protein
MKPMVYTKQNVLAFHDNRKFQTRRIINPQPEYEESQNMYWWKGDWDTRGGPRAGVCTHGSPGNGEPTWTLKEIAEHGRYQVGDTCYVAEGYKLECLALTHHLQTGNITTRVFGNYLADDQEFEIVLSEKESALVNARKFPYRATSGRFMYKSLARIFFEITEVRVEWLPDIAPKDCIAEGIVLVGDELVFNNRKQKDSLRITKFYRLWKSIHGPDSWNRWVFVYGWKEIRIGE